MAVMKSTISLPPELHERMEAAARREGLSFSAWVAQAGEAELRRQRGIALANEVLRELGGVTPEEWDKTGDELGLPRAPVPAEIARQDERTA